MVEDERGAMISFYENVILQKEAAERDRESALDADPSRRKRRGAEETAIRPSSLASAV